jgi:hypothetical protein
VYRSPLTVGNLVHDVLAAYYANTSDDPLSSISEVEIKLLQEHPDRAKEIRNDIDMARAMCEGYFDWLEETGADYELEVIQPERAIKVKLGNTAGRDVFLQGKLDGKVKRRDGWTAFLEHKTVGNFTDLPAIARIDRQLLTYHLLEYLELLEEAESEYSNKSMPTRPLTGGAILNMLRKVKRVRAKPPFYQREEIRHNIEELRNHWRHTMAVAREIDEAETRLDKGEDHQSVVPPTPARDCRFMCEFFSICPLFDDGTDVEWVIENEYEEHDPLERYAIPGEDGDKG